MSGARRLGREARTAARAAALPPELRPVWPGMTGGNYAPLRAADIPRIHAAALDVLAEIGMAVYVTPCHTTSPPNGLDVLQKYSAPALCWLKSSTNRSMRAVGDSDCASDWMLMFDS